MTNSEETGWIGQWSPSIGDPTFVGWLTVTLYAVAAIMCWRAALECNRPHLKKPTRPLECALWWFLSIVLWFLCINKQLDLQTAITETARLLSHRDGWYAERRIYQEIFIAGLVLGGTFCACLLLVITWKMSRSIKLGMFGLCLLGVFILTRASSFHHFDLFIGSRVVGIKWNWILEIAGIGVVSTAAYRRLRFEARPVQTQ